MPKPPVLAIDLDGTLIETAPDLMGTLNVILDREGLAPVSLQQVRGMVGQGAKIMLQRGFAAHGETLEGERLETLFEAFLEHYAEHIAVESHPFPGVVAALEGFRAEGWKLAVCTNKLEALTRRLLDELDLTRLFDAIGGPDTFGVRKPDPQHLIKTIDAAGGEATNAIMVGDSAADINAAKNASVPVVAVDFGYTDIPVSELGPDRIISHFDELAGAVSELRAAMTAG
ncbi:phosphoglycolate phosphatase [Rhodobium gokarnense]|uniref:Phosphoglycolate phosphatase n=1 Tax=Rhodobium gokarnense TaxID=364296 RepID=A0ABT3HGF1_9HYPH|nr:phosphoglycolate phosphatase [Rhodobium gokarnense]MCW2309480.1 phosphoglycolate phosphatase [Rhodobium gokarnense]